MPFTYEGNAVFCITINVSNGYISDRVLGNKGMMSGYCGRIAAIYNIFPVC